MIHCPTDSSIESSEASAPTEARPLWATAAAVSERFSAEQ